VQDENGTLWQLNGDLMKLHIHNVTASDKRGFPMHGIFTGTSNCACILTAANWPIGVGGSMATLAAQMLMDEKGFVKVDYEARASLFKVFCWCIFKVVVLACS